MKITQCEDVWRRGDGGRWFKSQREQRVTNRISQYVLSASVRHSTHQINTIHLYCRFPHFRGRFVQAACWVAQGFGQSISTYLKTVAPSTAVVTTHSLLLKFFYFLNQDIIWPFSATTLFFLLIFPPKCVKVVRRACFGCFQDHY